MIPPGASILEWDSGFWERRMGAVARLDALQDAELIDWIRAQGIDCVVTRIPASQPRSVQRAEGLGFRTMDVRVEFEHTAPGDTARRADAARPAEAADLPRLQAIARTAHHDSRFYADPQLPGTRCDELYATWISNSLNGYAQQVLVCGPRGEPTGYVTCHVDGTAGRIGLIAVAPEARQRGLGAGLVHAALGWFGGAGVESTLVATQAGNTKAMRLYERCGFLARDVTVTMHRWTDR